MTCSNCGGALEGRRCLSCAANAAKAQPHGRHVGGGMLAGSGLLGLVVAALLVLLVNQSAGSAIDVVLSASAHTAAQRSVTFTMRADAQSPLQGSKQAADGSGGEDLVRHRAYFALIAPGTDGSGSKYTQVVLADGYLYVQSGTSNGWTKQKVAGLSSALGLLGITSSSSSSAASLLPSAQLQAIQQSFLRDAKVVDAGTTTVAGHACQLYRFTPSSKAIQHLFGSMSGSKGLGALGALLGGVLGKGFTLHDDVAVDQQANLIRGETVTEGLSFFGQHVTIEVALTFTSFNQPVTVTVPTNATDASSSILG